MNILFITLLLNISPFFTIIDDDAASVESIASIHKVAEEKGVKICFGVIADSILINDIICDRLLQYQNEGHQICNHSLTHGKVWKNLSYDSILNELNTSEMVLDKLGFIDHDYFVYPWGRFNDDERKWLIPLVGRYFKLAFDSRGGSCDLNNYNQYYIHRFPIRKHDNITIVKYEIDKAINNGDWIVFMIHSNMSRDYSSDYVSQVIDYCLSKGMQCLTVKQVYDVLGNDLRCDETDSWSSADEIIYLVHYHVFWIIILLLSLLIVIVFFRFIKYNK